VLHRLIREVRAQIELDELEALGASPSPVAAAAAAAAGGGGAGRAARTGGGGAAPDEGQLLDLDEHDGDLLQHHHAFALSPISAGAAAAAAAPSRAAPMPPPAPAGPSAAAAAAAHGSDIANDDGGGGGGSAAFPSDPPKIRVVVRKRPINRRELERGDEDVVEVIPVDAEGGGAGAGGHGDSAPASSAAAAALLNRGRVAVHESKLRVDLVRYVDRHAFTFDAALDERVTSEQVYALTVRPLVATLLTGGKATCFAYGQTGSGKTHTMSPLPIRAAQDVLALLSRPEHSGVGLHLACFEIYGNRCFDLLNGRAKLSALEDAKRQVVVVGLREAEVSSVAQVEELIAAAHSQRSTGSTAANADSSRSHCIMQFALKKANPFYAGGVVWGAAAAAAASSATAAGGGGGAAGGGGNNGALAAAVEAQQQGLAVPATPAERVCVVGKISFIDLAGSERGADTYDNNRQTRMEGAEINKSLLALKECIRALDCDARHVPFRGSKLTAVLRDSFVGGNARTVMVANISPTSACVEHTLNTLRYADRVKELRKAAKGERTRGGVTPGGGGDYYASVERGLAAAPGPGSGGAGGLGLGPPGLLPPFQAPVPGGAPVAAAPAARAAAAAGGGGGGRRASMSGGEGPLPAQQHQQQQQQQQAPRPSAVASAGAGALQHQQQQQRLSGAHSFSGRSGGLPPKGGAPRASLLHPALPPAPAAAATARPPLAPAAVAPPPPAPVRRPRVAAAGRGPYGSGAAAAMAAAAAAAGADFFDDEEEQERALRDLDAAGAGAHGGAEAAAAAAAAASSDDDAAADAGGAGADTAARPAGPATAAQRAALVRRRDALMEAILEDEEEIVALHRRQIEEAMDVVRREMQILAEVDRPGSAIDAYVDALEGVLRDKAASVRQLQRRLAGFRDKLRQEEEMSVGMKAMTAALAAAAGSAPASASASASASATGAAGKRERVGRALGRLVGRV